MSVSLQVDIRDKATPALRARMLLANPHRVATRVAPVLAKLWRDHLVSLPRNKHGYPSTGFWEDAARSVRGIALGGDVLLSADKLGLRQRFHGGPIKAVNVKNITIPIAAESYGTTVKDWGDTLTLVILADGRKFLCLVLNTEARRAFYERTVGKTLSGFESRKAKGKIQAHASERVSKSVRTFSGTHLDERPPKLIIFKQRTRPGDIARAERYGDIKFLFKLQPEADQEGNPNVIPPDLDQKALALVDAATQPRG